MKFSTLSIPSVSWSLHPAFLDLNLRHSCDRHKVWRKSMTKWMNRFIFFNVFCLVQPKSVNDSIFVDFRWLRGRASAQVTVNVYVQWHVRHKINSLALQSFCWAGTLAYPVSQSIASIRSHLFRILMAPVRNFFHQSLLISHPMRVSNTHAEIRHVWQFIFTIFQLIFVHTHIHRSGALGRCIRRCLTPDDTLECHNGFTSSFPRHQKQWKLSSAEWRVQTDFSFHLTLPNNFSISLNFPPLLSHNRFRVDSYS